MNQRGFLSIQFMLLFSCSFTPLPAYQLPSIKGVAQLLQRLSYAPLLLIASKGITIAQERFGFMPTMLTCQVASLAAIIAQQHEHQHRTAKIPDAPASPKLGYLVMNGHITTTEKFHEALKQCLEDPQIKGILLKLDAEWGNLSICTALFHELKRAQKRKPLIALIEKSCCREPYLLATAADLIIAHEQAIVGMVGTITYIAINRPDPNKDINSFYTGKFTPLGDNFHQITPQDQELLVNQLETQYEQLCTTIAEQRELSLEELDIWADGKPFLGKQALELGLIDRLGTLSDVYDAMAERLYTKQAAAEVTFDIVPFHIS